MQKSSGMQPKLHFNNAKAKLGKNEKIKLNKCLRNFIEASGRSWGIADEVFFGNPLF